VEVYTRAEFGHAVYLGLSFQSCVVAIRFEIYVRCSEWIVFLMSSRVVLRSEVFRSRLELVAFCGDLARPLRDKDVVSVLLQPYQQEID